MGYLDICSNVKRHLYLTIRKQSATEIHALYFSLIEFQQLCECMFTAYDKLSMFKNKGIAWSRFS